MKRAIIVFTLGGAIGVVAGFALGIFAYPYIFLADVVAEERLENVADKNLVATGTFIHANPSDPIHYGSGGVTLYDDVIHLEDDFEVGPGPAYHVYLVPLDEVTPNSEVDTTMYIDLGRLRAFKGSQVYPIPAGIELKKYGHAIVWCERFGVLISPAKLAFK
ncbi:MAG: DM13 domain-containing protein [Gammaproteobacteria bacterium]|nr:DM13 domain-containing protein [Gammaproteobacteria bacterium]